MDMFERQFEEEKGKEAPLAARMRPSTFQEFVGQEHIKRILKSMSSVLLS